MPDLKVIQSTSLVAVHSHPDGVAVRATLPLSWVQGAVMFEGDALQAQAVGAALDIRRRTPTALLRLPGASSPRHADRVAWS